MSVTDRYWMRLTVFNCFYGEMKTRYFYMLSKLFSTSVAFLSCQLEYLFPEFMPLAIFVSFDWMSPRHQYCLFRPSTDLLYAAVNTKFRVGLKNLLSFSRNSVTSLASSLHIPKYCLHVLKFVNKKFYLFLDPSSS